MQFFWLNEEGEGVYAGSFYTFDGRFFINREIAGEREEVRGGGSVPLRSAWWCETPSKCGRVDSPE